jgi:hypothetical protein
MPMRGFMDRLPDYVIFAGRNVGDDGRVLDFVFDIKRYAVTDGNRVRHLQALNFKLALKSSLKNMPVRITNVIPGASRAEN